MNLQALRAITKAGAYRVAPTLYLVVQPSGSRSWVQRLTIHGKRHNLGIGSFDALTPGEAKKLAKINRAKVLLGVDVVAERREAKRQAAIPTFAAACDATFASLQGRWKTERTAAAWRNLLRNHAEPIIGHLKVDQVSRADVVGVVTRLHKSGAEDAARRLAQNLKLVFAWADGCGHVSGNVVDRASGAFPQRSKVAKKHHAMIGHERIAQVFANVDMAFRAAGLALRFIMLTGVRSGEARAARWSEVDGDTWTIPAERMKMSKAHTVPLSPAAQDILADARELADGSGLLFPSPYKSGSAMNDAVLVRRLRKAAGDDAATVHGLRATFRSWAAESGQNREAAEGVLAHYAGGVEGAYQRSDMLDLRRAVLERWANVVTGTRAKVTRIAA